MSRMPDIDDCVNRAVMQTTNITAARDSSANKRKIDAMVTRLDRIERKLDVLLDKEKSPKIHEVLVELGKTDFHTGEQTLKNRLDIIEGMLNIFCQSHMGHTNYDPVEFKEMHGFYPEKQGEES